jgi:hypothetical protein
MLVRSDCLLNHFSEVVYVNPFMHVATAFTKWARDVTVIFVALAVFCSAQKQIGFAIAM